MTVLSGFGDLNWLAVAVATVAVYAFGAVWYGALFSKPWQRLAGVSPDDPDQHSMPVAMGGGLVVTLLGVLALALLLVPYDGVWPGIAAGLVVGIGIASVTVVLNGLYESRPAGLLLLNAGHQTLSYVIAGAVVGAW